MLRQEAHGLYHPLHLPHAVGLVLIQVEVVQALGDDVVHRRALVERGGRVLEHHLDIAYHLAVEAVGYLTGYPDALVEYLAARAAARADDGPAYRRLARAGLADEREGLALVDVEARVLHGADPVLALAEVYIDVPEREQHLPAALVYRAMLREMVRAGVQYRRVFLSGHASPPPRC